MKQNEINIKLAEKTEQTNDNLDSFKKSRRGNVLYG